MPIGTRSKGTRVFHAPLATAWAALAAGASPGSAFVEATNCVSVSNPKRFDTKNFDSSALADPGELPVWEQTPGGFAFAIKQDEVGTTGTGTDALKALADATTPLVWVVLYRDGRACYFSSAVLIPQSEGDAANSITDEVKHTYQVASTGPVGTWQPHV